MKVRALHFRVLKVKCTLQPSTSFNLWYNEEKTSMYSSLRMATVLRLWDDCKNVFSLTNWIGYWEQLHKLYLKYIYQVDKKVLNLINVTQILFLYYYLKQFLCLVILEKN